MDDRVLSYHDVLLRVGDVVLLHEGNWLNDQIIEFVFDYLLREPYSDVQAKVALVAGSTAFLISNLGHSDAEDILTQLKCHQKDAVIFAVNDNQDPECAGGGSHWSMLVYWRRDSSFFHYDSSFGINTDPARSLAQKVAPMLTRSSAKCQLQKGCMPRQTNGSDCGVYVLAATEMLCQAMHQGGGREEFHRELQEQLHPETAVQLRSRYLKMIEDKSSVQ